MDGHGLAGGVGGPAPGHQVGVGGEGGVVQQQLAGAGRLAGCQREVEAAPMSTSRWRRSPAGGQGVDIGLGAGRVGVGEPADPPGGGLRDTAARSRAAGGRLGPASRRAATAARSGVVGLVPPATGAQPC